MFNIFKKVLILLIPIILVISVFLVAKNVAYGDSLDFSMTGIVSAMSNINFISDFDLIRPLKDSINLVNNADSFLDTLFAIFEVLGGFFGFLYNLLRLPICLMYDLLQVLDVIFVF